MRLASSLLVVVVLVSVTPRLAAQAQVADTQFSARRGHYTQPFDLVISTATPGATIRYSLDCTDPRIGILVAEGPSPLTVRIDPTSGNGILRPITPAVVVRAFAYKTGMTSSNVDTQTYIFVDRVRTQTRPNGFPTTMAFDMDPAVVNAAAYSARIRNDLLALPSMSVVASYAQVFGTNGVLLANNSSIEVPGSIEVMHTSGRHDQVDCGLTPHSWIQTKRSLRVYFRALYGNDKWRHDLFRDAAEGHAVGVTSFDGLVLRAGFNDGLLYNELARAGRYSFAVDDLGRSSQLAMTGFGPRGIFVHLYLNGLYWGLYNPIERPESAYWADTFGGDKSDYFARNHGGPVDGDPTWFNGLIQGASNSATVEARLDVPSFADYITYWTYCGGGDWPSTSGGNNNWYAGNRNLPARGRVRFFVWDCEDSWINLPARPGAPLDGARICIDLLAGAFDISILWRGAQNVADFRLAFADRVYKQCYNDGALSEGAVRERFDRIAREVDHGAVGESARWGRFDPRRVTWTRDADWLPYTNAIRAMFVGNTPQLVAALRNTAVPVTHPRLYPALEAPLFVSGAQTIAVTQAWVAGAQQIGLVRSGTTGTIYFTLNRGDPRGSNGLPVGTNGGTGVTLPISTSTLLKARTYDGTEWSALHELDLRVRLGLPSVEIHEVLAENTSGLKDEAGDHDDWVELRNRGLLDVPLAGYHLTDDPGQPTKWTFPAGAVVPAGGSVIVWADNEPEGPLHANFRLSGQGETVLLLQPGGGTVVDQLTFGVQRDDVSIGRLECEPQGLVTFPRPTPMRPNRPNPSGHISIEAQDPLANPLHLEGKGVPTPGDTLRWEMEGLLPGSSAYLAFGLAPLAVDLPGLGTILVDPLVVLSVTVDAGGEARFKLDLPDHKSVRGLVSFAQGVAVVNGAVRLSNGVYSRVSH